MRDERMEYIFRSVLLRQRQANNKAGPDLIRRVTKVFKFLIGDKSPILQIKDQMADELHQGTGPPYPLIKRTAYGLAYFRFVNL